MSQEGNWISLLEYAQLNQMSLSTLRRRIKANQVRYRIEKGKYFLWQESHPDELKEALTSLRQAQEEIAELKSLVAAFEERLQNS